MLEVPFGIVFDRGGFSEEMFSYFDAEGVYFFTWEKYFDIKKESGLEFNINVTIEREINKVGQYESIDFVCAETIYRLETGYQCRKLVIHTEANDNDSFEEPFYASILTNNPSISPQMIVELMTDRWRCQENGYKYDKKHFGLDQITSYDVMPVQSIQGLIDEQKTNSGALKNELTNVRDERQMLYDQLGVKRLTKKRIERIEKEADQNPQEYDCIVALNAIKPQLQVLSKKITQLEKKIKRIEKIEERGYVKLDYRKKQIFDHIRFTARNIFYNAIAEFREHYPNLRDLHVVFWKLIRSSGLIKYDKEQITVTLNCPFFEGKVYEAVQSFLETLNENEPVLLDGSNRKIVFCINS